MLRASPLTRLQRLLPASVAVLFATGAALAAPAVELDGELVQGGLVIGDAPPGTEIRLDGHPVRVSEDGSFILGFGRQAPPKATLTARFPNGDARERRLEIRQRDYDIERIDGLPPSKVTPSEAALERIRREAKLVSEARARDDARADFLGGFRWPALGRISGVYGSQRILNGKPRQPHYGIDIAAAAGTAVRAPASGVVSLAHPDMYFSGGTLMLDHGHGLSSTFLHLREISVEEGERVEQGEIVGRVGATGRATGAHLDWRMSLFDKRLDPSLLVEPMSRARAAQR